MVDNRPTWEEYFRKLAESTAGRANCTRRKVGAVVVKDNRIVSTGYNGAPAGHKGCLSGGCPRGALTHNQLPKNAPYDDPTEPGFCSAIHAESNAILYAGVAAQGSTVYVTEMPCPGCMKILMAAKVSEVCWGERADQWLVLKDLTDFPYWIYRTG